MEQIVWMVVIYGIVGLAILTTCLGTLIYLTVFIWSTMAPYRQDILLKRLERKIKGDD